MRTRFHKLLVIGLSLCLVAGGVLTPLQTAAAAEETSEVLVEEMPAADSEQEETEADLSTETEDTAVDSETPAEENSGNTNAQDSEVQNPEETVEETVVPEEPEELKENSFRYQNGELMSQAAYAAKASYPYAWEKVNGKYMNSLGQVIEGATKKGIDVSHHQGTIDWQKVKNDGIDFAIIRCGYGGNYTAYDDRQWLYNVSECERLGIPYGVYLYSYSENVEDAKSEAAHVLRLLKGHNPVYGVYYDLEDEPTTGKVSNTTIGMIAKTFCDQVSAAGYKVGIYANKYWWTSKLTSSVFQNTQWSKWVAQYNATCTYEGTYDIWQCTSTGSVDGISGNVDLNFLMGAAPGDNSIETGDRNLISGSAHVQLYGWMPEVLNGGQLGVTGESKRMEAFKISIGSGYGDLGIRYSSHIEGTGWQSYVANGAVSGTTGLKKSIQAVKIELTGTEKSKYDIYYRAHVQDYGWLGWTKNGGVAGTTGYSKRMEALQIAVLPKGSEAPGATSNPYKIKNEAAGVGYEAHMQTYGWLSEVTNGVTGGVTGESKRMEALRVRLLNAPYSGDIEYRAHVQNEGWQSWEKNGELSGTTGKSLQMEAVQIRLTGQMAQKYDIYYRAHVKDYGWLGWTKNGGTSGTTGYKNRMEAIQIVLLPKGSEAPGSTSNPYKIKNEAAEIGYEAHMQTYGWLSEVTNGVTGGVTGESKRMEALRVRLLNAPYSGDIEYRAHVQNEGWQSWEKNGELSGTTGKSLQMEAVQIRLTGQMAQNYDIYYRVHVKNYGWLGWTKNGQQAGTEGLKYRMEGIQIQIVKKGESGPSTGSTAFIKK